MMVHTYARMHARTHAHTHTHTHTHTHAGAVLGKFPRLPEPARSSELDYYANIL